MRNKLRAIWHIVLGDSVMYRITASREDKITFRQQHLAWWRSLLPPEHDAAIIECRVREDVESDWRASTP